MGPGIWFLVPWKALDSYLICFINCFRNGSSRFSMSIRFVFQQAGFFMLQFSPELLHSPKAAIYKVRSIF